MVKHQDDCRSADTRMATGFLDFFRFFGWAAVRFCDVVPSAGVRMTWGMRMSFRFQSIFRGLCVIAVRDFRGPLQGNARMSDSRVGKNVTMAGRPPLHTSKKQDLFHELDIASRPT